MRALPALLLLLLAAHLAADAAPTLRALGDPDRSRWRGAEAGADRAAGVGHVVVLNDSGGAARLEALVVGGTPLVAGPADAAGRHEFALTLATLVEDGEVAVTLPDGRRAVAPVVLDRRRPRHCRIGIWIRADRVEASPCSGFDPREVGASRRLDGGWALAGTQ